MLVNKWKRMKCLKSITLSLTFHVIKFNLFAGLPCLRELKKEIKGIRYTNKINICCLLSTPTNDKKKPKQLRWRRVGGRRDGNTYCESTSYFYI